jgi:tRNA1(Val) A37 N6-methylase TrmN6
MSTAGQRLGQHEATAAMSGVAVTSDRFLGGRLVLLQPRKGHRAGHDAILLAAATAARPQDRVVEFGAGVGAAGLALAARVPGIALRLVEIDPALAELAQRNAAQNGIDAAVRTADVTARAAALTAAGLAPDSADVVLMNPPYNDGVRHQPSPDAGRRLAHESDAKTLERWVHAARRTLRPGGALTLIWRAEALPALLAALQRGFGSVVILPVHPRPEANAIRVLIRAVKGGRAAPAICPGITLNDAANKPDPAIDAVLRGEGTLRLADV